MAYKTVYTLSDIRYLWKSRGDKNYEIKHLNTSGNLIRSITFTDIPNHREVSGKLVVLPREGEAYHWPRLKHENLAPLLDIVSMNENVSIYITTVLKRSLRDVTCEDAFLRDSSCFDRKKSYAEDVLWGLDYLHGKDLCLMSLSDDNIYINERDQAVITDFSRLVLARRATKDLVSVSALYRAPELDLEGFDALKAEVWACGVILLQIFTRYAIPVTFPVMDRNFPEFWAKLDHDVLIQANIGASITQTDLRNFQNFLSLFLCMDPSCRAPVKTAAVHSFLNRNPSNHKESPSNHRNSPKIKDGSQHPHEIDITENFEEAWIGKSDVKISKSDYMKPSFSDAMINREKLKTNSPSNKFINLQYLSICKPREDLLSNTQSNWNMQPMEEECNVQVIHRSKTQEAKPLPNTCERSCVISRNINNPAFNINLPKYFGIFRNSSFPSLYRSPFRGSLYCNTALQRSVSSGDAQLIESRGNCIPKPLNLNANNARISIQKWGYFSFRQERKTVGEGDRKKSQLKIDKGRYSGSSFNTDVTTLFDENNRSDSNSLENMEPNRMHSCSIVKNNSAINSNEDTQSDDFKHLRNINSNFLLEFIKESNCIEDTKQANKQAISDRFNTRKNNINHISSDFNEQNGIEEQQMILINPSFHAHKSNSKVKNERREIKDDDNITLQPLDFHDHIGVFERNLNSFAEVSLFQDYLEQKVEVQKKPKKKYWLIRCLCPGGKVYQDDK